jgi:MoxR-like ATPase
MVIATQLQAGGEGTYPLTDVQVDRFMLRLVSDYSTTDEEELVLSRIDTIDDHDIRAVATTEAGQAGAGPCPENPCLPAGE